MCLVVCVQLPLCAQDFCTLRTGLFTQDLVHSSYFASRTLQAEFFAKHSTDKTVAHRTLFTAPCKQDCPQDLAYHMTRHRNLCTWQGTQHFAHRTLHAGFFCAHHFPHRTLHAGLCILHTGLCAQDSVHSTLRMTRHTGRTELCMQDSVYRTLRTVLCTQDSAFYAQDCSQYSAIKTSHRT